MPPAIALMVSIPYQSTVKRLRGSPDCRYLGFRCRMTYSRNDGALIGQPHFSPSSFAILTYDMGGFRSRNFRIRGRYSANRERGGSSGRSSSSFNFAGVSIACDMLMSTFRYAYLRLPIGF